MYVQQDKGYTITARSVPGRIDLEFSMTLMLIVVLLQTISSNCLGVNQKPCIFTPLQNHSTLPLSIYLFIIPNPLLHIIGMFTSA